MNPTDHVTVVRRFQRSVRVDSDMDVPDALAGFICHQSNREVLENMAKLTASGQRAFTWTGPYGGGKSSLALVLAGMVSGNAEHRKQALSSLGEINGIGEAFPVGEDPWLFVPVVGRRSDPITDIRNALGKAVSAEQGRAKTNRRQIDIAGRDIIERFEDEAGLRPTGGVLLVIDEMGKFLEYARNNDVNIHFFQELAESAGRCGGRLIVLGILHQAFEQYADRLGKDIQDEWAKIQGRYVDIPIITAADEIIDLVGHAIDCRIDHPESLPVSTSVAEAVARCRPGNPDDLADRLDRCWPIHPVTAALLGPMSRSGFAQNKRSIFGFLSSAEPLGFQEYLGEGVEADDAGYDPAQLWDYLQTNLEPAITVSPDGHQWAQGVEAVERCRSRGKDTHIRMTKAIAIINLFRNSSGVTASLDILETFSGGGRAQPRRYSRTLRTGLLPSSANTWKPGLFMKAVILTSIVLLKRRGGEMQVLMLFDSAAWCRCLRCLPNDITTGPERFAGLKRGWSASAIVAAPFWILSPTKVPQVNSFW